MNGKRKKKKTVVKKFIIIVYIKCISVIFYNVFRVRMKRLSESSIIQSGFYNVLA